MNKSSYAITNSILIGSRTSFVVGQWISLAKSIYVEIVWKAISLFLMPMRSAIKRAKAIPFYEFSG